MKSSKHIKVLGIDPGLAHTGYNISVYNPDTDTLTVTYHNQIEAQSLAKKEMKDDTKVYGNIISLFLYEKEWRRIMDQFHPDYVTSEDAFYNPKMPNAFLSLKLCINSIQRVLYDYGKILYRIPPMLAKQQISKGNANKAAVQEAIQSKDDLIIKDTKQCPLDKLTEHEADSIAISYAFTRLYLLDLLSHQKEK